MILTKKQKQKHNKRSQRSTAITNSAYGRLWLPMDQRLEKRQALGE
jgi:hypothetical protein